MLWVRAWQPLVRATPPQALPQLHYVPLLLDEQATGLRLSQTCACTAYAEPCRKQREGQWCCAPASGTNSLH